jgi:hypothetical protein
MNRKMKDYFSRSIEERTGCRAEMFESDPIPNPKGAIASEDAAEDLELADKLLKEIGAA